MVCTTYVLVLGSIMKVEMSFTTKTIIMLMAMVLTVTVVISMVLIRESDSSLVFQQEEEQLKNQRRLQLFEDILHNRMVLWVDMFSHIEICLLYTSDAADE